MADEADVQVDPITNDPILADFMEEQDTSKADPSTAKADDAKPEVAEGADDATKGDDTPVPPDVPTKGAEDDTTKADDAAVDEVVTPADKPQGKADERKDQLNTEIRDLVSQRNALKAEVEKANAEVYQPATEQELVDDQGMTPLEAKVEAMRQEREVEKYNSAVAEAQLTIGTESERVLRDFPIFNPDSTEYDKELGEEAAELLRANLVIDPNTNQVIGSNVSPYQLYKTLAKASGISAVKGQIQAQAATEKQLANADDSSAASPPSKAKTPQDELIKFFSED